MDLTSIETSLASFWMLITTHLDLIINAAVAIGTIAMAYYTYKSIQNSEKQLKFLKKQTDLLLLEHQSNIEIIDCGFQGNKLKLTLKNSGKGSANDIAVSSSFSISPFQQKTKKPFLTYSILSAEKWIPGEILIILRDEKGSNSLPEQCIKNFECEPIYSLSVRYRLWDKILRRAHNRSMGLKFNDLRDMLSKNSIDGMYLLFRLFSKDKLLNTISHGRLCSFLVIFSKNENIESAFEEDNGGHPVDNLEVKTRLTYISPDLYFRSKYSEIVDDDE
jgi:hypothetical protein